MQPLVARLRGPVVCHGAGGPVDPSCDLPDQGRELSDSWLARPGGQRRAGEKVVQCVQESEVAVAIEDLLEVDQCQAVSAGEL